MATFPGFIAATGTFIGRPDDNQDIALNRPWQLVTDLLLAEALPKVGAYSNNLPVTLNSSVIAGVKARSFFDDFYNSIHFIPATIELGAVSGDTSVTLSIWNAYLYPVTLDAISFIDPSGVGLIGPAVPVEMIPLQTLVYSVTAGAEGAATIDAQIIFDFSVGTFSLPVTGTRARLSPIVPNWSSSFEVEYQFKTDIFTSRAGKEQRRALRQNPRKNVSYTATPTHDRLRAARNMLAGWGNNTIIIPELPRQAVLLEPMTDSDTLTLREDAPSWVVVGETMVLSYGYRYETREVEAVVGNVVTLRGAIVGTWPRGTKLHPGLSVRFADSISIRNLTSETATIGVDYEVIPGSELYLPTAASLSFNGREVFLTAPNWADPVNASSDSQREVVDYGRGRTAVFAPIPFSAVTQKMTYTGRDFPQAFSLVELFLRMKGQQGEFYMPTFLNDVKLVWDVPLGSRTIRVPGTDFARDLEDDPQRKAVAIYMKNGDVHLRKVDSISSVEDEIGKDSALALDATLPYDLTPGNVAKISWMPVWRMATDTFTMEWLTNSVAQCTLSVRMLEDLA